MAMKHWLYGTLLVTACAESASGPSITFPGADGGPTPPTTPGTTTPSGTPSAPGCADLDRDGYQDKACNANPNAPVRGGDCDDRNNLVNPMRQENCANQLDDDCDGQVNDGCMPCRDLDGDGFQDAACNLNRQTGGDCDDRDRNVNPGVGERCGNFKDDDCRAGDIPCLQNCMDRDLDGYGEGSGCYGEDCDDTNADRSPAGVEVCGDNVDQDCNNVDLTCPQNCQDADRDGFGVGRGCLGTDCNDADPNSNPSARDIPGDMVDQDCNGADLALNMDCLDRDQDGYGEGSSCLGQDCDDADPRVNPGRAEVCGNRKDDDCQGGDRGCSGMGEGACTDRDGDGFGQGGCPRGDFDCDDNNQAVFPDARETCNGLDDNCNGETDECARRGQRCVNDQCVSGPGAPCNSDDECDPVLALRCNLEVGECRVQDGNPCEESAQCNPGAECIILDACGGDRACYQAKGGPCQEDCDCTGQWLCQPETNVCVECLGDAQCNNGDVCTDGGFCAPESFIGSGDARDELLRVVIDCWTLFTESNEAAACASLTLGDPLSVGGADRAQLGPADAGDIADYVCNADGLSASGYSGDDISTLTELFGCGLFDVENIWWRNPLRAGSTAEACVYYSPSKSGFGFPEDKRAAVVIDSCGLSTLD